MITAFSRRRVRGFPLIPPPFDPWIPTRPRTVFAPPYVPRTGTIRNVPSGGNLQAAFDDANPGDAVVLESGATYVGNFVYPSKSGGVNDVYLESSAMRDGTFPKPQGERVTSSAGMAFLRHPNGNTAPILSASGAGRTGLRVAGIQFDLPTGAWNYAGDVRMYDMVRFGPPISSLPSTPAGFPGRFVMDRCRVIGREDVQMRRGVAFSGPEGAFLDSQLLYVNTFGTEGDSVGVMFWIAAGQGTVRNCEILGPSEPVMVGVLDSNPFADTSIVPEDITFTRCWLRCGAYQDEADPAWNGRIYNTKNLGETKSGRFVEFSDLLLERHLGKDQQFALTLKSNGEGTLAPTTDVTVRNIKMVNVMAGIALRGFGDDPNVSALHRVSIDNVGMLRHRIPTGRYTVNARMLQITDFARYISASRITAHLNGESASLVTSPNAGIMSDVRLSDSILGSLYGIGYPLGDYMGLSPLIGGERTLARLGIISQFNGTTYGDASNRRVVLPSDAQFASYSNSESDNMRLQSGSPFKGMGAGGADPGCDWDSLDFATRGCVSGVWT